MVFSPYTSFSVQKNNLGWTETASFSKYSVGDVAVQQALLRLGDL